MKGVLARAKANGEDLEPWLPLEYILDRNSKHSVLTDVTICLTAVNSELPTTVSFFIPVIFDCNVVHFFNS